MSHEALQIFTECGIECWKAHPDSSSFAATVACSH
jgi:hypothetical protein